ncbi:IS21-like element helper ATPase IstB [Corallococcus sp. RDP092CA]|uniref:IS21-like element helper ATPase IstB n=1 Tax=Myxococcaceae TaxID=31 RepID=UPI0035B0B6A0
MLNQPTLQKLQALRLSAFARAWEEQQKLADMSSLAFDERLALLVEAEWLARENARIGRNLREAKLRISGACVEDIDFTAKRELDKPLVRQLAQCRWVEEKQNIVITGMTGTGKTYLACALAQAAIRRGHRVLYRRAPRLLEELALAHAEGSFAAFLSRLARVDVLVIDDWALAPIKDGERRDMLEVFEDRYGARSTIIASQLPTTKWHDHLGDPTVADAICDRVLHRAHRLTVKGPSRRKEENPST